MILGLTGGIASGKSTVSKIFSRMGVKIIDADEISRMVADNAEVLQELAGEFGEEIIIDGRLDRKKLREIVFESEENVGRINSIMHPKIISNLEAEIDKNRSEKLLILDIPLLYEAKLDYLCEKVLLVFVDEETQIERVIKRDGCSKKQAENIIEKQMPLSQKKELADYYIDNSGSFEELENMVQEFYSDIMK